MGLFSKTASDNTAEYVHCISERAESARKGHHWPRRTFTEQTGTGKEFFYVPTLHDGPKKVSHCRIINKSHNIIPVRLGF